MRIELSTPALLFPATALLLLAYTNRFLALSSLIRGLVADYRTTGDKTLVSQIQTLRHRVALIRRMQGCAVASMFICVLCMFTLFAGEAAIAKSLFGFSLIVLMGSLSFSLREIQLSTNALNIALGTIDPERDDAHRTSAQRAPAV